MKRGNFWALLPLIFFVVVYFTGSYILGDFYALPVLVIFVLALFVAFFSISKGAFRRKIKAFFEGFWRREYFDYDPHILIGGRIRSSPRMWERYLQPLILR